MMYCINEKSFAVHKSNSSFRILCLLLCYALSASTERLRATKMLIVVDIEMDAQLHALHNAPHTRCIRSACQAKMGELMHSERILIRKSQIFHSSFYVARYQFIFVHIGKAVVCVLDVNTFVVKYQHQSQSLSNDSCTHALQRSLFRLYMHSVCDFVFVACAREKLYLHTWNDTTSAFRSANVEYRNTIHGPMTTLFIRCSGTRTSIAYSHWKIVWCICRGWFHKTI